jgi:hypothetical protein
MYSQVVTQEILAALAIDTQLNADGRGNIQAKIMQ